MLMERLSLILIEEIVCDLSRRRSTDMIATTKEMIKAEIVALVSLGLLSDAPTVAYISF
jgi:hypothetical protein